eukprot:6871515-Prymnesium_polylepis.1
MVDPWDDVGEGGPTTTKQSQVAGVWAHSCARNVFLFFFCRVRSRKKGSAHRTCDRSRPPWHSPLQPTTAHYSQQQPSSRLISRALELYCTPIGLRMLYGCCTLTVHSTRVHVRAASTQSKNV